MTAFAPEPVPFAAAPRTNGLATAGLVLGIIALVTCWFPPLAWLLAILAIIFGAIGLSRAKQGAPGKGLAMAGLVLGIVSAIAATAIFVWALGEAKKSFETYMEKGRRVEAQLHLNRLGKAAKVYYIETAGFPEAASPLFPSERCCTQPGRKCTATYDQWEGGLWGKLEFTVDDAFMFQYEATSTPGRLTARAVGDLDCDGETIEYRLEVTAENGNPVAEVTGPFGKD